MFEVSVAGWFAAAHQLRLLDGSLEPLHGHNWQVDITYRGAQLDESGLLLDFVEVRRTLDALLGELHDTNLNEHPAFKQRNPSAENVAVYLAERLMSGAGGERLAVIAVEEAPGCVARYAPTRSA